jgi:hypothetical protein
MRPKIDVMEREWKNLEFGSNLNKALLPMKWSEMTSWENTGAMFSSPNFWIWHYAKGLIAILATELSRKAQIGPWTIKTSTLVLNLLIYNLISSILHDCWTRGQLHMENV